MTRSPNLRRLAVAAGLLLMFAASSACGSDDEGPTATPDAPASMNEKTEDDAEDGGQAAVEGDAVDIKDFNYEPANVKVKAGTEVTFTNSDQFAHTVTANDKSFDSGNMDKDAVFKQTFDKAGTYKYFCSIHNSMTGQVTVE